MQLQQQIDSLVRERDALRANAVAATVPQDKPGQRMANGPPSAENIPPMPTNPQDLEGWLSERNCELRNAIEYGDVGLVALVGGLVGQGATQLGLGRHRDVPMDGESRSALMSGLIEDQVKRRCLGAGAASVPGAASATQS